MRTGKFFKTSPLIPNRTKSLGHPFTYFKAEMVSSPEFPAPLWSHQQRPQSPSSLWFLCPWISREAASHPVASAPMAWSWCQLAVWKSGWAQRLYGTLLQFETPTSQLKIGWETRFLVQWIENFHSQIQSELRQTESFWARYCSRRGWGLGLWRNLEECSWV